RVSQSPGPAAWAGAGTPRSGSAGARSPADGARPGLAGVDPGLPMRAMQATEKPETRALGSLATVHGPRATNLERGQSDNHVNIPGDPPRRGAPITPP